MEIKITGNMIPKQKPETKNLVFGTVFTDRMFMMKYNPKNGWHDAQIMPYGPISLDPSSMVFHYAQEIFEGLKAYRTSKDGDVYLFRPEKNFERMNRSCNRMCIPNFDGNFVLSALEKLINMEKDWIPTDPGTSLYIRPFIIATDCKVGVHPSREYLFIIILSPVGSYFSGGLKPVKIFVETEYVRASRGGTGYTKCGGNYAASLIGQVKAEKLNYSQVLWLDAQERKYIEEVGAMNVFFKIGGKVITPSLEGSILPGVTRMSVIELLRYKDFEVEERLISIDELMRASDEGTLEEAWGTGTAAVISPIGKLNKDGKICVINGGEIGKVSQMLYDNLTGIQWGLRDDPFGWRRTVKESI